MATQHLNARDRLQRAVDRRGGKIVAQAGEALATVKNDRLAIAAVWILAGYLVLKMFYVFSGGSIQPADAMVGILAIVLVNPRSLMKFLREEAFLSAMVAWIAIVNIGWFLVTAKANFLPSILYYFFNIVIVLAVFSARLRQPILFDRIVPVAIMIAILLETIIVFTQGDVRGVRSYGSFRNPNQLAYWGICLLSILLVIRRNKPRLIDLPFIFMVLYCEYSAASRAGLIAIIILLMMWLFFALRTPVQKVVGLSLATVGAIALMTSGMIGNFAQQEAQESRLAERLASQGDESQFEERNYDRIVNFYQYTIVGAGEGYLSRFRKDTTSLDMEIHSSFGTMLFSYGIPGLVLFIAFLANMFFRMPLNLSMYLLPGIIYGITHQGLRFSFFWILIGVMLSVSREFAVEKQARDASAQGEKPVVQRNSSYLRSLARKT